MSKIKMFFKHYSPRNYLWPLLSGFLIGTSYIPLPPWALLFGYAPLWLFLCHRAKTWQEGFAAGWWTQFTLTLIGFHWIAYVAKEFGGFPLPVALLTLLLFAALAHLYIPLTTALVVFLKEKYSWSLSKTLAASALLLSIAERIWPSLFQWHLGYTLFWIKAPAYNWADVIGFEGLSSILLLLNAWLAWLWEHRHQRRAWQKHSLLFVSFLTFFNLSGYFHGQAWNDFDRKLKISIIQANIGNEEKVYAEKGQGFQDEILHKFLQLTRQAVAEAPNTELIVWPETAFPDYLDRWNSHARIPLLLAAGLQPLRKTLLTGAYAKDAPGEKSPRLAYNALFLVDANGHQLGKPYHKTHLLAFGEYLPFSERFPILLKLLPFISNFGRGQGPEILIYPHPEGEIKFGAQVCYEGLYPEFTRGLAEKQADILANVTNDSWFGWPFEPRQHMLMTLARAIEVRRPLIRSTNTGISTVVLANGDVLQHSPLHKEWQGSYDLQLKKNAPTTNFVLWGHFDWILILLALIGLFVKGVLDARTHRS
ncbi:MAG TPA: apolipoprotein N-acyltransferase [Pseudobdellovibrionaceae bacterium]